jgi:hypothetical protein
MNVGAIVTGHGEVQAVPILIRRVGAYVGVAGVQVPRPPFRVPEGKLKKPDELERAVRLVSRQVGPEGGVLILLDCDDGCPAGEGPKLLDVARHAANDVRVEVVMAKREYEAWFLAAAESLAGKRTLPEVLEHPDDAEAVRNAKGWLDTRMKRGYSETLDQPAFSQLFDLAVARERSKSFDKLVRAVAALVGANK